VEQPHDKLYGFLELLRTFRNCFSRTIQVLVYKYCI